MELSLTAGSNSSMEPETEPKDEPEVDVAALGEKELRAELVKVRLSSEPAASHILPVSPDPVLPMGGKLRCVSDHISASAVPHHEQ